MSDDYLWNRSGSPDPDVARLEELLAPLGHDAPLDELRPRRRRRAWWIAGGALAAVAAVIVLVIALPRHHAPGCGGTSGFAFTGKGGEVTCGGAETLAGVLPVGGSLDTGAHEAELAIATIGKAELGPHTRVRLEATGTRRHQLALDEGTMHAKVDAPPRLFAVSTKHASVVDLGCEYTITVDAAGAGSLAVQHGKVELATATGAIVVVPIGTHARIRAGNQPGLPLTGQNAGVAKAVDAYEAGAPGARDALLAAAGPPDAITVVALAAIDPPHRAQIVARLAELSPPPDGVTVEAAVTHDDALAAWRDEIVSTYVTLWRP